MFARAVRAFFLGWSLNLNPFQYDRQPVSSIANKTTEPPRGSYRRRRTAPIRLLAQALQGFYNRDRSNVPIKSFSMSHLLAIDDEAAILGCFRAAFANSEIAIETALSATEGLAQVSKKLPDVILLDIDLPDLSGLETYRRIREIDPKIPVIFVTGSGSTDTAIEAIRLGAYDYILKPFRLEHLQEVVGRAFEVRRLMNVPAVIESEVTNEKIAGDVLVGRCPAMQDVYKAIGRVASQNVTVLILGESGTGKELVARAIYNHSRRAEETFLAINCAALSETLLESELFGHEKGAFTGATQRKIGKFEQCSGGTLFLDEVGDMTPMTQTKILRVLQEQRFERVGGNETVQTDVRLVAATNVDLERAVVSGRFRRDLYYRLNVYAISLPPLRDRGDDIPLLVEHFMKRFRRELGKDACQLAAETMDRVRAYPWPGNLRELQSVLKHALLEAAGPVVSPECLPASLRSSLAGDRHSPDRPSHPESRWESFIDERLRAGSTALYAEWQSLTERLLFERVLRHVRGNLSKAAKILGIHRVTLRSKIDALGMTFDAEPAATDRL
jgi:two-component system nitrogen regulation response regulator GlnG